MKLNGIFLGLASLIVGFTLWAGLVSPLEESLRGAVPNVAALPLLIIAAPVAKLLLAAGAVLVVLSLIKVSLAARWAR